MLKNILLACLLFSSQYIYAKASPFYSLSKDEIISAGHSGKELNEWYNTKVTHCRTSGGPAYLCSGLFIRVTESNSSFYAWDPSSWSARVNGISFSWIRKDFNFTKFRGPHGYILYPQDYAPSGRMYIPQLRCAYPFNANTFSRKEPCGANGSTIQSSPCKDIKVTTSSEWVDNFNKVGKSLSYQCSFSFTESIKTSVYNLGELIKARYHADAPGIKDINNEFVFSAWPTGTGKNLPIHSFFYIADQSSALAAAQSDQKKFYNAYQIFIPIVKMVLPKDLSGHFQFSFSPKDQGVNFSPLFIHNSN